jgi:nickel superoxide dismutase
MKTNKLKIASLAIILLFAFNTKKGFSHCEIPCGIYGDSLRVELMAEHIETIEKSMNQINLLSEADAVNYNQLVRWINNKERHANLLQEIVSQYFLTQRIHGHKDDSENYESSYFKNLELLHQLLVLSMKAKQSTNPEIISDLRETLKLFSDEYFHDHY